MRNLQTIGAYHPNWQKNRINFIINKYGKDFFKDKKILELGPFNGYIGNYFSEIGADVSMVEGRQENVNAIKRNYPNIKNVYCYDLDTNEWPWGKYDIIINFGLVYHLENYHSEHIKNCLDNCDMMFFESVIFDSSDSELYTRKEVGQDQSLSGGAGTPSTSFIEDIFSDSGVKFTKYNKSELNGNGHTYDWKDINSKIYHFKNRRFWIIENS